MSRVRKAAPRILVVDADPALLGLLEEWLGQGWRVVADLAKEILALRNGGRP
jgi:CheY-like chemotaxis protein